MFFRNLSFRVKIFLLIFISIFLPVMAVSAILYGMAENAVTEQTVKVVTNSIDKVIGRIDYSFQEAARMSSLVLDDRRFAALADYAKPFDSAEKNQDFIQIRDVLESYISRVNSAYILPGLDSCCVYLPYQHAVVDSKTTYYENVNESNVSFYSQASNGMDGKWYVADPVDYYTLNGKTSRVPESKVITYGRLLKSATGQTMAALAINVNSSYINESYSAIESLMSGEFVVMDGDGRIVSHPDASLIGSIAPKYAPIHAKIGALGALSGSFFLPVNGVQSLVIYSVSAYTGWSYAHIIPASAILGNMYRIKGILVGVILPAAVILMLLLTYALSYFFYTPLLKLVTAMQKVEGRDLSVRIDDRRRDEYHKVYKGFNDMTEELKRLIHDLTSEKILKKEAQIKLLQAQINPHFMYNTLESIYSIAKIKGVEEIAAMTAALSRFFRISLSGGRDEVPLREALELAVNYLTIQNIRFKGKIRYEISVPEGLMGCVVPKFLLQPVVENSIFHGIESIRGQGLLTVNGSEEDGVMTLKVADNGKGIGPDRLRELRESLESDGAGSAGNFALRNLSRQIKLKYGDEYGLKIDSTAGEGTAVEIRIPCVGREM